MASNDLKGGILREAQEKDSEGIWAIRNNPLNRKNFNDREEIGLGRHKKWFRDKYLGGQRNKCFVLEIDKKVAGYCRFDLENDGYLTSIAVSPEYAGKGLGGILLSGALKELKSEKDVFAEVRLDNLPSLSIFKKNGFIAYKTDNENYYLILKR